MRFSANFIIPCCPSTKTTETLLPCHIVAHIAIECPCFASMPCSAMRSRIPDSPSRSLAFRAGDRPKFVSAPITVWFPSCQIRSTTVPAVRADKMSFHQTIMLLALSDVLPQSQPLSSAFCARSPRCRPSTYRHRSVCSPLVVAKRYPECSNQIDDQSWCRDPMSVLPPSLLSSCHTFTS